MTKKKQCMYLKSLSLAFSNTTSSLGLPSSNQKLYFHIQTKDGKSNLALGLTTQCFVWEWI